MLEDYPTAKDEGQVVDQYRNAEDQARRGGRPCHPEGLPPLEPPPRTPQRNLERPRAAPLEASNYQAWGQASARDTGGESGLDRRGQRDPYARAGGQHDDHHAPRSPRQCGEYGQYHRQGVPAHRAGNASWGQCKEAEAARGRQRAAERLTRLESEMADFRRELDVVQEPPREEQGRQEWREAAPWGFQRR
ncbi:hypothetical protein PHMEG_0006971 [Phytophthora megakarya]|uniref:Uncharacterized protein n=1 Tax=Phytophthora megakarya TaxID=4795 RepID=A0A225WMJ6_9STRA|nr:hypothetical protein PHMEG_0006971 [Phytophthora megakarya]